MGVTLDPTQHDDQCESDFIGEAGAWTACRCSERSTGYDQEAEAAARHRARFEWPWGQLSAFRLVEEQVTVDGVVYDVARVRTLIHERHRLASEATAARMDVALWRGYAERRQLRIDQLEARLNRADTHLQRRTAALVRMIAKKGPRLA